ncbi:hypothetical protein DYB31_000158 [Aphanomyces astaci]|uniref:DUF1279 domain-containing protein n=1 Tax=Aphanomyces astaci TaxID=112090 RepID=A0A397F422_APHAT|nr:hypothetical protein DYB31_000158 [Aphanomyces astaci]
MSFVPYITCYVQLLNLITRAGGGRGIWHATRAPLGKLNPDACRHISSGGKGWLAQHGEKLKQVTKEYGKVAVVFHSSVFIAALGAAYTSIRMGVDIRHVKVPFVNLEDVDPDAGSFFLAYLVTLATDTASVFAQDQLAALWRVSFPTAPVESPLTPHPRWLEIGFSSADPWLDIHTTMHLHCLLYVAEHQNKLYMRLLRRNVFPVVQTLLLLLDTLVAHVDGKGPCPCCSRPNQGDLFDGLEFLYEERRGSELELVFTRMVIEFDKSTSRLPSRFTETRQLIERLMRQRPTCQNILTLPVMPTWCDILLCRT